MLIILTSSPPSPPGESERASQPAGPTSAGGDPHPGPRQQEGLAGGAGREWSDRENEPERYSGILLLTNTHSSN